MMFVVSSRQRLALPFNNRFNAYKKATLLSRVAFFVYANVINDVALGLTLMCWRVFVVHVDAGILVALMAVSARR